MKHDNRILNTRTLDLTARMRSGRRKIVFGIQSGSVIIIQGSCGLNSN